MTSLDASQYHHKKQNWVCLYTNLFRNHVLNRNLMHKYNNEANMYALYKTYKHEAYFLLGSLDMKGTEHTLFRVIATRLVIIIML